MTLNSMILSILEPIIRSIERKVGPGIYEGQEDGYFLISGHLGYCIENGRLSDAIGYARRIKSPLLRSKAGEGMARYLRSRGQVAEAKKIEVEFVAPCQ